MKNDTIVRIALVLVGLISPVASAQTLANPYHAIIGSQNAPSSDENYRVSVHPSNPGFSGKGNVGSISVAVNETFDHPVIGYRFFNAAVANGTINSYASSGSRISPASNASTRSGSANSGSLWTTTDPDSDPNQPGIDFLRVANFTTGTMAATDSATGTIDISNLEAGTLYFFYGSYRARPNFALTMSGPGLPDVVLATAGNQDSANNSERYVTTVTFADAAGYDTISYHFTSTNGQLGGIVLTQVPAADDEFKLLIAPNGGNYDFSWVSRDAKLYDLVSSTDLATPISDWPIWDGWQNVPPSTPLNTITGIPTDGDKRFFALIEKNAGDVDLEPPAIATTWGGGSTVTLAFSEKIDPATAIDPANYIISQIGGGTLAVTAATLGPDGKTVTLTLAAPLGINSSFSVAISDVTDLSGNPVAAATSGSFRTWDNDPNGIQVFILAGQSNMVGYGHTEVGTGSLRYLAVNDDDFPDVNFSSLLVNPAEPTTSAWIAREDVKIWWRHSDIGSARAVRKGNLTNGFGQSTTRFGPEYGFGWQLGEHFTDKPVLIVKAAWGGKSLHVDFRPPSAVAARAGNVGPYYTGMIEYVRDCLHNLGTEFPEFAGQRYRIAGFGWHQGYNDRVGTIAARNAYESNLVDLIHDLRAEFGVPNLPVSITTTGMAPPVNYTEVELAQLAMADPVKYPQFQDNVRVTDTRPFWREEAVSPVTGQGYHWNHNAESMYLNGTAMGATMIEILEP